MSRSYRPFSAQEVEWGIAYAKNEHKLDLPFLMVKALADDVRAQMLASEEDGSIDDLFESALDQVAARRFGQSFKHKTLEEKSAIGAEMQAYRDAVGKMHNNRRNMRKPSFSPDTRVSPKRKKKAKVVARGSQLAWKFPAN